MYHKSTNEFALSVIGYVGNGSSRVHVGKSSLIQRFLSKSTYSEDHLCVISPTEFDGEIVGSSHWLYWGSKDFILEDRTCMSYHIVEQCEFLDDHLFVPFSCNLSYSERCLQRILPVDAKKLAYICKPQLGNEISYPKTYFGPGSLLVSAYICVYDMTLQDQCAQEQSTFLKYVLNFASSNSLPLVLVTSKNDSQISATACVRLQETLCGIKRRWLKESFCLVETSSRWNVNVQKVFHYAAMLAYAKSKRNFRRKFFDILRRSKSLKVVACPADLGPLSPYYFDSMDSFKVASKQLVERKKDLSTDSHFPPCPQFTQYCVLPPQPRDATLYNTLRSDCWHTVSTDHPHRSKTPLVFDGTSSVVPTPPPMLVSTLPNANCSHPMSCPVFRFGEQCCPGPSTKPHTSKPIPTIVDPLTRIHIHGDDLTVYQVAISLRRVCPLDRFLTKNGIRHRVWILSGPLPSSLNDSTESDSTDQPRTSLTKSSSSNSLTSQSRLSAFSAPVVSGGIASEMPAIPRQTLENTMNMSQKFLHLLVYSSLEGLKEHQVLLNQLRSKSQYFLVCWALHSDPIDLIIQGVLTASRCDVPLFTADTSTASDFLSCLLTPSPNFQRTNEIEPHFCWTTFRATECEMILEKLLSLSSDSIAVSLEGVPWVTLLYFSSFKRTLMTDRTNSGPALKFATPEASFSTNCAQFPIRCMRLPLLLRWLKTSNHNESPVIFLHCLLNRWYENRDFIRQVVDSITNASSSSLIIVVVAIRLSEDGETSSCVLLKSYLTELSALYRCSFSLLGEEPYHADAVTPTNSKNSTNESVQAPLLRHLILLDHSVQNSTSYRDILEGHPSIWSRLPEVRDFLTRFPDSTELCNGYSARKPTSDSAQDYNFSTRAHDSMMVTLPWNPSSIGDTKSYFSPGSDVCGSRLQPIMHTSLPSIKANPDPVHTENTLSLEEYYSELPKMSQQNVPSLTKSCRRFNRPKRPFPRSNSNNSCSSSSSPPIIANLAAVLTARNNTSVDCFDAEQGVYAEVNDALCSPDSFKELDAMNRVGHGSPYFYAYSILPDTSSDFQTLRRPSSSPRMHLSVNDRSSTAASRPLPSICNGVNRLPNCDYPVSTESTSSTAEHPNTSPLHLTLNSSTSESPCKVGPVDSLAAVFRRGSTWLRQSFTKPHRKKHPKL